MNKFSVLKHSLIKYILLAILILFFICVIFKNKIDNIYLINQNKKTINSCFTAIKYENIEMASKYIDYNKLINCFDELILENREIKIEKELFKDIEWDVENIEIKDDIAYATIKLTNKDYKILMTKWIKQLIEMKNSSNEITNKIALAKLQKNLFDEKEVITTDNKITLTLQNGKWMIEVNENLRNLMYPGIENVIYALNLENSEQI